MSDSPLDPVSLVVLVVTLATLGLVVTYLVSRKGKGGKKAEAEEPAVELDPILLDRTKLPLSHLREVSETAARRLSQPKLDLPELVDYLVVQAHNLGASDIHFTPLPTTVNVEIRRDGLLYDVVAIPKPMQEPLLRRLKILSRLDVFSRDLPQDGHIAEVAGQQVDIRLSTLPVAHGEKAVLRLISAAGSVLGLGSLGLTPDTLERFRELCTRPQGLVVLTGPTGSGKTTTIYATLQEIKDRRRDSVNIVTIEDPIESEIAILSQTQVNEPAGLTFARGLRSILRQDPDVIMVGEIRDAETAQIAIQAGLTGHLIFTSIHADSAAGIFNRLITMGVEPFLVASACAAVLSQRLVRRLCDGCRRPAAPAPHQRQQLERLGVPVEPDEGFWVGAGCEKCMGKGDQGRVGLFELLVVDELLRTEIVNQVPTHKLTDLAAERGMRTLLDDGLDKARRGIVSLEEVMRVVV